MYFQLLAGSYACGNKKWNVEVERDGKGAVLSMKQPIVESNSDLLAAFGPEKFRQVTVEEAKSLRHLQNLQTVAQPAPLPPELSLVEKAAMEGAKEIAEPPGVDVTSKYPEIQDDLTPLKIYYKRGKGYYVMDGGEIITQEPLKREDVVTWVESYRKG